MWRGPPPREGVAEEVPPAPAQGLHFMGRVPAGAFGGALPQACPDISQGPPPPHPLHTPYFCTLSPSLYLPLGLCTPPLEARFPSPVCHGAQPCWGWARSFLAPIGD